MQDQHNTSTNSGLNTSLSGEAIELKLVDQEGKSIRFRVKKAKKLVTVMNVYAQKIGVPRESLRFIYDESVLNGEEVIEAMPFSDNDIIEVFREQTGGGSTQ